MIVVDGDVNCELCGAWSRDVMHISALFKDSLNFTKVGQNNWSLDLLGHDGLEREASKLYNAEAPGAANRHYTAAVAIFVHDLVDTSAIVQRTSTDSVGICWRLELPLESRARIIH